MEHFGKTLLIADDDQTMRMALAESLAVKWQRGSIAA